MQDATVRTVKMHFALGGAPVEVATCGACGREAAISPAVAAENGLPKRCAGCGSDDLRFARYRVVRGALEPA